mmetsp:Transcript_47006/g.102308  ORF Transcript_47006/g.102308 Transcript_47006/m.102308 type:complete len:231 (-) Transcript_47006:505-1197(-)
MVAAPRLLGVGPASSPVGKACIAVIGIAGATSLEVLAAEALLSLRPAPPPVAIPRMAIIGHRSRRWGWGGHDATHMELCAAESLLGNRPSVQEMSSGITIEGKSRHGSHVIMRTAHLVVLTAPKFLSQRPNFQRPFVAVVWHGSWRRTAGDTFMSTAPVCLSFRPPGHAAVAGQLGRLWLRRGSGGSAAYSSLRTAEFFFPGTPEVNHGQILRALRCWVVGSVGRTSGQN